MSMTREQAWDLLTQYNQEEFHLRHAVTVEHVMRWFARELGYGDREEFWGIVGLLHDLDFERWPEEHCKKSQELMRQAGVEEEIVRATASHGWGHCVDIKPEQEMEKVLFAVDELTGLIGAAALMRPSKSVSDMELKSLKKKFKDKKFAAGCSRDVIAQGAELLGWELDQLLDRTLSAMREEEAAMARAEQLRSNLLRSISHDLRTPLTSISGNAGVLMSDGENLSAEHRSRIYRDIYDDSMWLINLVENLLSITRMEGQGVHLHMETELLEEVIDEAMRHINRRHEHHTIRVNQVGDYILADMDARLIIQVITNLVDNAVKYTPEGSTIMVNSRQEGASAVIDVSDNGPGIPDESKEKIFEMFYTTGHKSADGKRGMGLGLPLCRAILSAHKGTIEVLDNKPAGSIFRLTLPAKEVSLHE